MLSDSSVIPETSDLADATICRCNPAVISWPSFMLVLVTPKAIKLPRFWV